MQSEGFDSWFDMETLAVRGYVEAARSIPRILSIRRQLYARLRDDPPDLFIGVDAPDFNLGLEERLRASGIPTVHYVGPSIWAWRSERIHKIKRAADKVLALFPFEPPIYEKAGIPVAFVGHPLADEVPEVPDRDAAREQFRLPAQRPRVRAAARQPAGRTGPACRPVPRDGEAHPPAGARCALPGAAHEPPDAHAVRESPSTNTRPRTCRSPSCSATRRWR